MGSLTYLGVPEESDESDECGGIDDGSNKSNERLDVDQNERLDVDQSNGSQSNGSEAFCRTGFLSCDESSASDSDEGMADIQQELLECKH